MNPQLASFVAADVAIKCTEKRVKTVLQMTVEVPPAFHIFYATGWEEPVLRFRELHADGTQQHEVSHRLALGYLA